jgi:ketosteroid isomerase-like protein
MSLVTPFVNYAIRFEQAYADDDWTLLEPFFTEDAAYVVTGAPALTGTHEGRAAVLGHFRGSIGGFDRRFGRRAVEATDGPYEKDGAVKMPWVATYSAPGAPDLRMEGESTAHFRGGKIHRLEDHIPTEAGERMLRWLSEHGSKLRPTSS